MAAARSFQLGEGRLPTSWDDLTPAHLPSVPDDPYGTGGLKMLATPDRFAIYSVGENGEDDGGKGAFDREERMQLGSGMDDIVLDRPAGHAAQSVSGSVVGA